MSTLFTSTLAYLNKSQLLDNIFLAFKCLGNVHFLARTEYSHFLNYAPPLDVKGGIITEKVFPVFSECFLDLFWLGHVHLGVNGCHRKVCISNVKK